ncbi:MAG: hypothetical protein P0Y62_14955 [Candidatus Chryseobacterium colombiense]|nr:DUF6705 family protein [Chryseobacterium sp.]WEK69137.1 MAG: hypothetical protein P0Y62_14955 [Chryseobacterium sp.]
MKNKIIYTLLFLTIIMSCKAQTITLQQLSECQADLYPCPNYTNAKDIDNLLGKFVGIWKATYADGRTYEFHFTKKIDDGELNERKWDILIGRMLIKKDDGTILENSISALDDKTHFNGFFFDKSLSKYQMYYSGNADCNDKGYVYLSFPDSNNLNQMRLVFMQDMDIIASCPSGYKTVMPDAKDIILTKQ